MPNLATSLSTLDTLDALGRNAVHHAPMLGGNMDTLVASFGKVAKHPKVAKLTLRWPLRWPPVEIEKHRHTQCVCLSCPSWPRCLERWTP